MNIPLCLAISLSLMLHLGCLLWLSQPISGTNILTQMHNDSSFKVTLAPTRPALSIAPSLQPAANDPVNKPKPMPARHIAHESVQPSGASDHYWPSSMLDVAPSLQEEIPENPIGFEQISEGGKLVLVIFISRDGAVDKIDIEHSDLSSATTQQLSNLFLYRQFSPGIQSGKFVRSKMRIEITLQALPRTITVPADEGFQANSLGSGKLTPSSSPTNN